jgi:hypothetical protein
MLAVAAQPHGAPVLDGHDPIAAVGAVERAGTEELGHPVQPTLARVADSIVLPSGARAVLAGPDFVARQIANRQSDPQQRWILGRPRAVRRSFLAEIVDGNMAEERWMLLQDDETRLSYVAEVLEAAETSDRQAIWLLTQPREVRESYVAEVID